MRKIPLALREQQTHNQEQVHVVCLTHTRINSEESYSSTLKIQHWKFCGKARFPHSFGRIARNYVETVPFRKISTPGNQVKLRYFLQCEVLSLGNCGHNVVIKK